MNEHDAAMADAETRTLGALGHKVDRDVRIRGGLFRGATPAQWAALTSPADETLFHGPASAGKTWTCLAFLGALPDAPETRAAVILPNRQLFPRFYESPVARRMVHIGGVWTSRAGATVMFFDASYKYFERDIEGYKFSHLAIDNADLVSRVMEERDGNLGLVGMFMARARRVLATTNSMAGQIVPRFSATLRDARTRTVIHSAAYAPTPALPPEYVATLSGDFSK